MVTALHLEQNPSPPPTGAPMAQPVISHAAARLENQTAIESRTELRHSSERIDEQQQSLESLESLEQQRQQLLLRLTALNDQRAAFDQPQYNQNQTSPGLSGQVNNQASLRQQLYGNIPNNNPSSFPSRTPPTTGLALAGLASQFQWPTLNTHALSDERASLGNAFQQYSRQQQNSLGFPFQQQLQHQQTGNALELAMQQQGNNSFGRSMQHNVLGLASQQQHANNATGSLSMQQQDDALSFLQQHLSATELAALLHAGQQQTVDPIALGLALQQQQRQQQQQQTNIDPIALGLALQQQQQQQASLLQNLSLPSGFPESAVSSSEQLLLQYLATQQRRQQQSGGGVLPPPPRNGQEDEGWPPATGRYPPF
jgi:hypothetical protein